MMLASIFSTRRAVMVLALSVAAVAGAAPRSESPADSTGSLLASVERQRKLISDQICAEVENELRSARSQTASDPAAVEQAQKLMLERVLKTPELNPEVRAQLRGRLEAALREASRRAATRETVDQRKHEARSAAIAQSRVADALSRQQEKLKQLMDRFDSLMDEGRFAAAETIGSDEVGTIAPETPIAAAAALLPHETQAQTANSALRAARSKAVVNTLASVETSMLPFSDDQPMIYPDSASWEALTLRRGHNAHTDLRKVGPAEAKIQKELGEPTTMEFVDTPLQDAIDYLKDVHNIEIQLEKSALEEAGVGSDTPVTRTLKGISLRSALRVLLADLPTPLTYVIEDEVLKITTVDKAASKLVIKAYPVADLVTPIRSVIPGGPRSMTGPGMGPSTNPGAIPGMGPGIGPGMGPGMM